MCRNTMPVATLKLYMRYNFIWDLYRINKGNYKNRWTDIYIFIAILYFVQYWEKYCCVPGCGNTSNKIGPDGHEIILHRLPMSEMKAHIKKLWIQRLKNVRANLINDHTRVCSAHFAESFTHESIPTIFPSKPMKQETTRRPLIRKVIT